MKRNKLIQAGKIIAIALLISGTATAQKRNEFSLKQAIDYGLKNSYQVKNSLLDILIQRQVNNDVTSAALPQINANGNITDYLDIPVTLVPAEFFGGPAGTYEPIQFGTKWTGSAAVTVKQVLFDGEVFAGLAARKVTINQKHTAEEVEEIDVKENIYKVYFQLVASKTQIQLLDANIARLQKLEHDTREMYKNGFNEKLDVDKVTVQLANLNTEELRTKNSILNGYNSLKILIGMPIKDTLILTDTLNESQIKEGVLESVNYNYTDRKDYQLLQLGEHLNQLNVKRYTRSQIPTLYFNGSYGKQGYSNNNSFDLLDHNSSWYTTSYIGVQLSIPIFNGLSTRSKIQESRLQLKQSQNQLENMKLTIDKDVDVAKNNFATAISAMDYQQRNMELAEGVYDQTKKKYENGNGATTEINQAEVDLKTAENDYIQSLYDAISAKVDFLKAVGKL